MSEGTAHDGGCLCGAVRYRAEGAPLRVLHCHCQMCRKAGGAPFVTWAVFPRRAVRFVRGDPGLYRSSPIAVRRYCRDCGSALTWEGDGSPDSIDLTVGSFDHPDRLPAPVEHLWTEAQIPWLHLADDLPRHPRERGSQSA